MDCGLVLVVDDDPQVLGLLKTCLEAQNFVVLCTQTGQSCLQLVRERSPDVVVLDLTLPDMDGLSVCREIRKTLTTPVLILSAQNTDVDKIVGLEVGADDYLGKPFNPRELVARVRALHRRRLGFPEASKPSSGLLVRGDAIIDTSAHSVQVKGHSVHVTPTEFLLLCELAGRPGQVLSRQALLDRVWGPDYYGDTRIVDVHVRHLRKKLKAKSNSNYVVSVRGVGYKWDD